MFTFKNTNYDNVEEFWKVLLNRSNLLNNKIQQQNESTSDSTLNGSSESYLNDNLVFKTPQCANSKSGMSTTSKMFVPTVEKSNKRRQIEFKDNRIQNMEAQIYSLQEECAAHEVTIDKLRAKINQ